jgi:outer membrane lipopolysaccharide assembly protein LptE/RlpB
MRHAPEVCMKTRPLSTIAALALLAGLAGCGYGLVGKGSNIPPDIKAVYLQPLENKTPRTQVEQFLTRAIADELVTRHRFSVISSESGADAEISGSVISFGATPVTFDNTGRATEYEIAIIAQVIFKRLDKEQHVLWKNDRYLFRESYPVMVSGTGYVDLENTALESASKKFAQTMVSDLLEGF